VLLLILSRCGWAIGGAAFILLCILLAVWRQRPALRKKANQSASVREEHDDRPFSQLSSIEKLYQTNTLSARWKQLYEIRQDATRNALNYLLLINAGGAAATLAFVGAIGVSNVDVTVLVALMCFVFGIVISGVIYALDYHLTDKHLRRYTNNVNSYYRDKKHESEIEHDDQQRPWVNRLGVSLGWLSFVMFLLGVGLGIYALLFAKREQVGANTITEMPAVHLHQLISDACRSSTSSACSISSLPTSNIPNGI